MCVIDIDTLHYLLQFCKRYIIIGNLRLEAQNYKWKPNQDLVEYYFEELARYNKCEMKENEIIEWMVHGLNDIRFRDFLYLLEFYK